MIVDTSSVVGDALGAQPPPYALVSLHDRGQIGCAVSRRAAIMAWLAQPRLSSSSELSLAWPGKSTLELIKEEARLLKHAKPHAPDSQ